MTECTRRSSRCHRACHATRRTQSAINALRWNPTSIGIAFSHQPGPRRRARGYMVEERSHPESESRPPVRAAASVRNQAAQRFQGQQRRVVRVAARAAAFVAAPTVPMPESSEGGAVCGSGGGAGLRRHRSRSAASSESVSALAVSAARGGWCGNSGLASSSCCGKPSGSGGPAYLEAELRGLDRSHVATRTTADHDEVVRLCGGGRVSVCVRW